MKVLLKEDVDNLGYAGEVHDVAAGFGRNFLIPQGLAVKASPSVMKQAETWRRRAEARREEMRAEYEALTARIEDTTLTFTARAGDTGKLYGSITMAQVADEMNERLGTDIDRRKVGVEPLRQLGEHKVIVRLSGDFQPHLTVVIESEDGGRVAAAVAELDEEEVEEPEEAIAAEEEPAEDELAQYDDYGFDDANDDYDEDELEAEDDLEDEEMSALE
jgi:large subunit ribosomal protein L9